MVVFVVIRRGAVINKVVGHTAKPEQRTNTAEQNIKEKVNFIKVKNILVETCVRLVLVWMNASRDSGGEPTKTRIPEATYTKAYNGGRL